MKVKFQNIDDVNRFVHICELYDFNIDICVNHYVVDAKSLLGIIALGIQNELFVLPHAHTPKENEEMLRAISTFAS